MTSILDSVSVEKAINIRKWQVKVTVGGGCWALEGYWGALICTGKLQNNPKYWDGEEEKYKNTFIEFAGLSELNAFPQGRWIVPHLKGEGFSLDSSHLESCLCVWFFSNCRLFSDKIPCESLFDHHDSLWLWPFHQQLVAQMREKDLDITWLCLISWLYWKLSGRLLQFSRYLEI